MNDPDQHYWTSNPDAPSAPRQVELLLPDVHLSLTTDRGVFSADQVDRGTRFLLLEGPPPLASAQNLLDVGCGYGPIACSLAVRHPQAHVWAVDTNQRALALCRTNAEKAGLTNVTACLPEEVPEGIVFDAFWSNPPIRIGKPALHDLLLHWLHRLSSTGEAHLVVQRHLGADSLARWLDDQGWLTVRRNSRKGFRLLDVERKVSS